MSKVVKGIEASRYSDQTIFLYQEKKYIIDEKRNRQINKREIVKW